MFIKGSSHHAININNHCEGTQQLCELIHLKPLLENNFQGPMFIRGSPPTTQTNTVWAHTTIVWVN